jgi:hypothetical protein
MRARHLLGSTALGAAMAAAGPSVAAEVSPGGALDIKLSGFVRFLAIGGDRDDFLLDDTQSTGLDFFNDTELHVELEGKHDATGVEYGGTIELEGDTSATANSDETWIFLKGGFGEVRLGDEDGVADADGLAVGAKSISTGIGTDGIEGDEWEEFAGGVKTYEATGSNDATKIRYISSSLGGFRAGVSYTPNLDAIGSGANNGDSLAAKDVEAGDVAEAGLLYETDLGGMGLSVGLTGLHGDIKDEDTAGGDDFWQWQAGAVVKLAGFKIGGSYQEEEAGALEVRSVSAGISRDFGSFLLALTYGQHLDTEELTVGGNELDQPYLVILSGTVPLMPGLTLDGDVGYFDNDVEDGDGPSGDHGWQAIGRLGLAF